MKLCLKERLLLRKPDFPRGKDTLWVHCASVGEFNTVLPLLKELRREYCIALTYFSPRAKEYLEGRGEFYDLLFPLPIDLPPLVVRFERMLRPRAMLVVERELWPSMLRFTKVKKILLNAYSTGGFLERRLIGSFSLIVARTERDRERLEREGAKRVVVCGNLKAVQEVETESVEINLPDGSRLLVAGSTREGEERAILEAFYPLRKKYPLKLVIAPRHVSRALEVKELVRSYGLKASLRSEGGEDWDVLILDTLGELRSFYAICDVAFVGGTLVPVGGHNLLEPAFFGKPVVFGPNTDKVKDLEEILLEKGCGFKVRDAEEMRSVIEKLLSSDRLSSEGIKDYAEKVKRCYMEILRRELEKVP